MGVGRMIKTYISRPDPIDFLCGIDKDNITERQGGDKKCLR